MLQAMEPQIEAISRIIFLKICANCDSCIPIYCGNFDLLFIIFRIDLWPSAWKELSLWLNFHLCCFNFSAVLVVGVPFPFIWCLGQEVEFDCIGS